MNRNKFGKNTRTKVFRKSAEIVNKDSALWRSDRMGRIIARAAYGDRNSKFGWNIHHRDGNPANNILENLEAVHHDTHDEINRKI